MTLRIGIVSFLVSSLGVLYRVADLTYSAAPTLKWGCLGGLCLSLYCLTSIYLASEGPRLRKSFAQPDMLKSPAWTYQSQE